MVPAEIGKGKRLPLSPIIGNRLIISGKSRAAQHLRCKALPLSTQLSYSRVRFSCGLERHGQGFQAAKTHIASPH
jgi:hypothetical protein